MKHTPGPWTKHIYSQERPLCINSNGRQIAFHNIYIGHGDKIIGSVEMAATSSIAGYPHVDNMTEMKANAALFMAAPDLLDALPDLEEMRMIADWMSRPPTNPTAVRLSLKMESWADAIEAAKSKAEGKCQK